MAFANFSLTTAYAAIITALNTQLTAVGSLFKDQTSGDFVDQVRYNSALKRLERWTGSAWAALDVSGTKPFRGALVYSASGATAGAVISWTSESYDSDNIHDLVTNPSRLIVPTGVSKVKIAYMLYGLAAGNIGGIIYKNGTAVLGGGYPWAEAAAFPPRVHIHTPALIVVPGDYFEVRLMGGSLVADSAGIYNWFAMEIIE